MTEPTMTSCHEAYARVRLAVEEKLFAAHGIPPDGIHEGMTFWVDGHRYRILVNMDDMDAVGRRFQEAHERDAANGWSEDGWGRDLWHGRPVR